MSAASGPPAALPRLAAFVGVSIAAAVAVELARRFLRGPVRETPPTPVEEPVKVLFGRVEGKEHGEVGELMDPPVEREDPLFWIRDDDRKSEKVLSHLKEENAYTNYMTLGVKGYAKRIYRELLSHFMETDETVPTKKGGFVYYSKTVKGKSYKFYCRKNVLEDGSWGDEEILLDVNKLAKAHKHCDIGSTEVSPDGNILAYSIDTNGYETYEIRFVDLETGQILEEDTIPGTYGGVDWGKDGAEVYYGTFDDAHRPHKIWRHKMKNKKINGGLSVDDDDLCLYTENDTEFNVYASKSLSGRFLMLSSFASTLSELRYIDLDNPQLGVRIFREREKDVLYDAIHAKDDTFYVVTNKGGATNFAVMQADLTDTTTWKEFIPYDKARKVDGAVCFKDFVIIAGRQSGFTQLWVLPKHDPNQMYPIPLKEESHTVGGGVNLEYDATSFRYHYSSLTTPSQVYEFKVDTRKSVLLKEKEVPLYDRSIYKTERLEAKSYDGTMVPISIVYNSKAVESFGPNRLHLYGYGSYEHSVDPSFAMSRLPLLDRGVVFAIAHIRGGGEYGREWYESAKYETKKKTFEDFCACAEKLVEDKRTTPELMSMEGRSAGGLLMGAVMNMRPDLFKAVIAGVPFVDVLNTMSDPSIPLTTGEWQEWGNPHQKKYFDAIKEYCPYTNVAEKPYPATLIMAGLYDPRVMYSEPAKWAAKLRKYSTSDNPILLKVDLSSGHFSASNRYTYLREISFELAWLLRQVGAPDDPTTA